MAYYEWNNKEKLIADLKESASTCNFLINQGLVASSGNYDSFKIWTNFHNIIPKNFFAKKKVTYKQTEKKDNFSLDKIFINNSDVSRNILRNLVKKHKLIEYKCAKCGNCGSWNGEILSLQLEHKNGNSTDNRIENLEYLCPNCHSQTLTYGSKNKHNRFFKERLKDLMLLKEVKIENIKDLSLKWNIDEVTVEGWLRLYRDKIEENNIVLYLERIRKKKIEENLLRDNDFINIKDERLIDLKKFKELKKSDKDFLSKKWQIGTNAVKKWIKNNHPELYIKSYLISEVRKKRENKEELFSNVSSLIKEAKQDKELNIELFLPLFNHSKSNFFSYMRTKFPEENKIFNFIQNCTSCHSENTRRFGQTKVKGKYIQRYRCLDCEKKFY